MEIAIGGGAFADILSNGGSFITNGYTQITWQSVPVKSYTVKYSSDLSTWNTLGNSIQVNGSTRSTADTTPVRQVPRRFYRVFVDF